MAFCYVHRSVPCSAIVREASSCSFTAGNKYKLKEYSFFSFLLFNPTGPLCVCIYIYYTFIIYYGIQFYVFIGFLSVKMSGLCIYFCSLCTVPSVSLFGPILLC